MAVTVTVVGAGSALANKLTHRHQVVVVVGNDDLGGAAWKELLFGLGIPTVALRALFFHSEVPQEGHRVGWIDSDLLFTVASIAVGFKGGVILKRYSVLDTELILPDTP
jgi:hypothetical protein